MEGADDKGTAHLFDKEWRAERLPPSKPGDEWLVVPADGTSAISGPHSTTCTQGGEIKLQTNASDVSTVPTLTLVFREHFFRPFDQRCAETRSQRSGEHASTDQHWNVSRLR